MLYGLFLILIGAIAAVSFVSKFVKNADQLLNKIAPYQGWLGVGAFVWGIWGLIYTIMNLGWLGTWPIWWITQLITSLIEIILGFMLGYGLISKYVLSKNEAAKKKGDEILKKLAGYQTTIGIIGMAIGVWYILYVLVIQRIINL